jgi:hypothetical protein
MSKKFKNKTCVYCCGEGTSTTGDHVFAREFFLKSRRANLPQVPACAGCNKEKSELEHYLEGEAKLGRRDSDLVAVLDAARKDQLRERIL